MDLIYTYNENSNRDSVEYHHLATPVWDKYYYDTLQRLIEAEYGSLTGIARLDDYVGDVRFAAGVASKWLTLDEPFMELARLQIRSIRQNRKQVRHALVEAGLDAVVKDYNNGEMPLVSLVEFGEDETHGAFVALRCLVWVNEVGVMGGRARRKKGGQGRGSTQRRGLWLFEWKRPKTATPSYRLTSASSVEPTLFFGFAKRFALRERKYGWFLVDKLGGSGAK